MTIRKSFMSVMQLASLFLLAVAVIPAIAADTEQLTVSNVTFTLTVGARSSDKNDFKISAINSTDAQPTCSVEVVFKNEKGDVVKPEYADTYPFVVKIEGKKPGEQAIGSGLIDKKELPVTHTLTARCY
jgi:hypothetical protein